MVRFHPPQPFSGDEEKGQMMTKKDLIEQIQNGTLDSFLKNTADDEPIFILVARDNLSGDAVRSWADRLEVRANADPDLVGQRRAKVADARRQALQMDEWRNTHGGGKLPD